MSTARHHPEVIEEYLQKELAQSNILGPFPLSLNQIMHVNQFGVVPKKHQPGKWHLITDLPFPKEESVNNTNDTSLCSLKYITVEQVARRAMLLDRGSLIAKIHLYLYCQLTSTI